MDGARGCARGEARPAGFRDRVLRSGRLHMDLGPVGETREPVGDPWRDLEQWFAAHLELQRRYEMTRGCPFGTLGNEVSANDELIRQDVSLIFEVVKHKLASFFLKEKAKGRLAKRADTQRMADFCLATIQGAMLMGNIKRNSQPVEAAAREAIAHVKSYLVKYVPRVPG